MGALTSDSAESSGPGSSSTTSSAVSNEVSSTGSSLCRSSKACDITSYVLSSTSVASCASAINILPVVLCVDF